MSLSYYSPDLLPYQFFSFPVKILEDIISFKNKWFNFVEGEENEKKRERIEEEKGNKIQKTCVCGTSKWMISHIYI